VGVSAARWVVFDLDGTLIESEQVWGDVRHAFTIAHGGRWTESAQSDMIGMRTAEWAHYMHDALGVTLAPDEIARSVVAGVAAALDPVPVLPGADAALDRLARTFRLGLATSAALPVARAVLARTGWADDFAVVVSADDVAHGKPAPDVYLRALALLGADAASSAAVEDSANGIRSAHTARLAVIAIPNRAFPPDNAALALATSVLPALDALDARAVDAAIANRA
jgi:beta-phosphoglucomutase-like phosphatase (HAD superfamily)